MVKSREFIFVATTSGLSVKCCFVLVKSYSISPVRLRCIVKKALFLLVLRSVLITYLITSSLEKEIIVLEKSLEKVLNFGSKNLFEPCENNPRKILSLFRSFFEQFIVLAVSSSEPGGHWWERVSSVRSRKNARDWWRGWAGKAITRGLGPVIQRPIIANPGLNFILGFFFFLFKRNFPADNFLYSF